MDVVDGKKSLTIYLHGEAETPHLTTIPTEFTLIDLDIDVEVKRVLMIKNQSKRLPITLKYNKVPYVFIKPPIITVEARTDLEIEIYFKVAKIGQINTKISFDLLHENKLEKNYQCVGKFDVPLKMNVNAKTKTPKPKFNMGITPMCTNEVGFLTDDVRFNTAIEKPQAAMVQYKSHENDDALIAFPNDRSRTFKPWRNDVT